MASWQDIEKDHPDFARAVQQRFDAYRHKVLATLRKDGSPRISGIKAEFASDGPRLGMMPGSLKARDLQRDPRFALHSGTEDPDDSPSAGYVIDAKLAGRAIETSPAPNEKGDAPPAAEQPHYFTVDIAEVVLISIGEPPDHLVIETWRDGHGLRSVKRY